MRWLGDSTEEDKAFGPCENGQCVGYEASAPYPTVSLHIDHIYVIWTELCNKHETWKPSLSGEWVLPRMIDVKE